MPTYVLSLLSLAKMLYTLVISSGENTNRGAYRIMNLQNYAPFPVLK